MIFAKIENMDNLPECCDRCSFQGSHNWCSMLPAEKQVPMIADMDGLRKRKNCPLRESFREIYTESIGTEWKAVKDELPEEDVKVLCLMSGGDMEVGKYRGPDNWVFTYGIVNNVRYWMPLPNISKCLTTKCVRVSNNHMRRVSVIE